MKPWCSGSNYFNYKGFFSVVLLAIVNANYEFIYCDIGAEGKNADGGIWHNSDFNTAMTEGRFTFPPDIVLDHFEMPCHFIADDAFPMTTRCLKPYAHKLLSQRQLIFNYRLSRARRLVENVFGIVSSRFRVLKTEIYMNVDAVTDVVMAICILHNLLRQKCGASYMGAGTFDTEDINYKVVPGDWRQEEQLTRLIPSSARNSSNAVKTMRDNLSYHFLTPTGEVAWQYSSTRSEVHEILESLQ